MIIQKEHLTLKKENDIKAVPFVNLQQLYEFEFSTITGEETNELGLYDQEKIKAHWSHAGTDVYVLYYQSKPIGFAVINLAGTLDNDRQKKDVAEFFIMPKYRHQGIGEWMAKKLFDSYEGTWQVRQLPNLEKARSFWLKTINDYTNGDFTEIKICNEQWKGTVQEFKSKKS